MIKASVWLMAGAGMVFLLISAMKMRNRKVCRGIDIEINRTEGVLFVSRRTVENLLTQDGKIPIKGRKLESLRLREMEATLEKNSWVQNAELYVDNNQVLRVSVKQKKPVARVFSVGGTSFYVDSACERLPVTGDAAVKLPVFTGYPWDKPAAGEKALLRRLAVLGAFVLEHPYWMAAISQLDITADRQFEMIPTLGHHVVELGSAEDPEREFARLYLFYKEVLPKVGMEKYERVRAQFDGQVVAVKRAESNAANTASTVPPPGRVQQGIQ